MGEFCLSRRPVEEFCIADINWLILLKKIAQPSVWLDSFQPVAPATAGKPELRLEPDFRAPASLKRKPFMPRRPFALDVAAPPRLCWRTPKKSLVFSVLACPRWPAGSSQENHQICQTSCCFLHACMSQ